MASAPVGTDCAPNVVCVDPAGLAALEAVPPRSVLVPEALGILSDLNTQRLELGLPTLIAPAPLIEVAFLRSEDMRARGYLGHTVPQSEALPGLDLMVEAGFTGRLGEEIFAAAGSVGQVGPSALAAWMSDPLHRGVLLDPLFRYAGVGLAGDPDSWILTLVLAESRLGNGGGNEEH